MYRDGDYMWSSRCEEPSDPAQSVIDKLMEERFEKIVNELYGPYIKLKERERGANEWPL